MTLLCEICDETIETDEPVEGPLFCSLECVRTYIVREGIREIELEISDLETVH